INLMMAVSLIALLPILILFLVAQRFFIKGIVLSGLKG
ncbi:MAG: carbohydrate ABC transporter permease, partial [bacterium]|nr:carbohydrate ABC transporter permease [bacterium]